MKRIYIRPFSETINLRLTDSVLNEGVNPSTWTADEVGAKQHNDFDFSDDPLGKPDSQGGQAQDESVWSKNFWDD